LLQEGQIKLSQHHTIPSADQLKKMKYCKWHNATSHDTNECKVFRQQIQSAIEQGRLKFETPAKSAKPMKIDQHPFPANMVNAGGNSSQTKVLTSESARRGGAVDPRRQITTEEIKRNRRGPERPRKPVTSQFLLSKYRQQQEQARYQEEMIRRHEDHWQCPFFIHCWENDIRLPSADNCPECNRLSRSDRPRNSAFRCMIGWGAELTSTTGQKARSANEMDWGAGSARTIGWKRWPMTGYQTRIP
jgi:hypothetical protein